MTLNLTIPQQMHTDFSPRITVIGASRRTVLDPTTSGIMIAPTPSSSDRLAMFEPTMLPTAISGFPPTVAIADTSSSGQLVPNPMITTPTTSGERLRMSAIRAAPSTN